MPEVIPRHTPKPSYSQSEWDARLQQEAVSKNELNQLVMDYLITEGYTSAAEEFAKEADLPQRSSIDFSRIESRMEIKRAVQRGDIKEAIEKLNDLDPVILETNPTLYFHLHQQRFIELIRKGNVIEALDFAEAELAPRGEENPQFLAELEQTMALLAFDLKASAASPAGAPIDVAELLLPSQRQRTANELNLAILESQRGGKEAKMTTLLRVLVWAEALLSEKADFPRVDSDSRRRMRAMGSGEERVGDMDGM